MTYGHWVYRSDKKLDPEMWAGFCYRIVDLDTGRQYIGKKFFWSTIRKKVKGRKNRKVVRKESDWMLYTGSSKELNSQIEKRGKHRFEFYIESLHETKGSLYYAEVQRQITEDVLRTKLPNGERKFYNGLIAAVKFIPPTETVLEESYKALYKDSKNA